MGHIKEPGGVDFVINSRPLTKKEENAISEYIRAYKAKHSQRKLQIKRTGQPAQTRRGKTPGKKVTA